MLEWRQDVEGPPHIPKKHEIYDNRSHIVYNSQNTICTRCKKSYVKYELKEDILEDDSIYLMRFAY